jgi:hypothetical protein
MAIFQPFRHVAFSAEKPGETIDVATARLNLDCDATRAGLEREPRFLNRPQKGPPRATAAAQVWEETPKEGFGGAPRNLRPGLATEALDLSTAREPAGEEIEFCNEPRHAACAMRVGVLEKVGAKAFEASASRCQFLSPELCR